MVAGYRIDRKPPKTDLTIRACAAMILEAMKNNVNPETKKFGSATVTAAYRLLLFERLIRRQDGYGLTEIGNKHIAKNGFHIYKPVEEKK